MEQEHGADRNGYEDEGNERAEENEHVDDLLSYYRMSWPCARYSPLLPMYTVDGVAYQ